MSSGSQVIRSKHCIVNYYGWIQKMNAHLALVTLLLSSPLLAQSSAEWRDNLVDHLAGSWTLQGKVMGNDAHHSVKAGWVLNHQFLRIEEKTAATAPPAERRYDSVWYLGYDPISERYVLHLMDVFGGRFSETLGYGTRDGNRIKFVFEYPDGPFHTTYVWNGKDGSWEWLMEQKGKSGKWGTFADLKLTPFSSPR
jgi:hypothetical protein